MTPAQSDDARLRQLLGGYRLSQAIHVAAVLRVADALLEQPLDEVELAKATDADSAALGRLMRALAAAGVFTEDDAGRFANNELSLGLVTDTPGSVRAHAVFVGSEYHWNTWSSLIHSARTGTGAFEVLYGTDPWTYRAERPEESAVFDAAMKSLTEGLVEVVAATYDFEQVQTVVDVGGGNGTLLMGLLTAKPHLSGTVFDLAHVIDGARDAIESSPVQDRLRLAAGSMFEEVPPGADCYLLKSVVHDWDDDEAVAILARCRDAMTDRSALLIVERLLEGPNRGAEAKLMDLTMLVMLGGRERTEDGYAQLCRRAGLRLTRTLPVRDAWCVLEAVRS
ncbi:MAG: methyltransferase [Nocardioidaceae bacterium]